VKQRTLIIVLSCLVVGMFFFSYALVPLYNVLCKTFGINGKVELVRQDNSQWIDKSRHIRVQFLATNNANLPWDFYPKVKQIEVHPGQNVKLAYFAKNNSNREMTIQAIPSITPGLAAGHLQKTECFCFNQQTLKAHQSMDMPLIFHVDTKLPKNIHELTLSYTLFEIKKGATNQRKRTGKITP